MNIVFLGTGAADFSPLMETEFKNKPDNNARRSRAIVINDAILVDCGPHILDFFQIQSLDCSKVTAQSLAKEGLVAAYDGMTLCV